MRASSGQSCATLTPWLRNSFKCPLIALAALCSGLLWLTAVWAQDAASLEAHPLIRNALALEARQSREQAITEYKRYLFFHSGGAFEAEVYYRIGLLLRDDGQTDQALLAFSRAAAVAVTAEDRLRANLSGAATLIAAGRHTEAEVWLLTMRSTAEDDAVRRRISYHLMLCYLSAYRWDEALQELHRAYPPEGGGGAQVPSPVDSLAAALSEAARGRRKSEAAAQMLSVLVPGSGQIYAGDLWDGLNALAVSGLSGALVVQLILDRHYGDAALALLYVFNRFYFGNIENARLAARERNDRENRRALERVLPMLEGVPEP